MSGRFVRASKFRHVYGQPTKKELFYDNLRVSRNAWDSNLIKANPKYLSVNWEASGGGAFAVIPLEERGKLPDRIPLFRGHTAVVLDTDWNPFDDDVLASGSDDAKVAIWRVPDDYKVRFEDPEDIKDIAPLTKLSGHSRKVGHVQFHPVASNVLASSSADYSIKIWDVEKGSAVLNLQHKDLITSFSFNATGSLVATTSRDKKLRVWDLRAQSIVSEGPGHTGAKVSRVTWLGDSNRLATTGFSKLSDRQLAVWDSTDISKGPIGGFQYLDASSGVCMPLYDSGTRMLYLAGKGDGNIRYFEFLDDSLYPLSEYQSSDPQRGVAFLPKRSVSVHENEVVRVFKTVNDSTIEPISFFVPRRAETFQADIYPDAPAGEPALTAEEWFSGKDSLPKVVSLEAIFDGVEAKAEVAKPSEVKSEPAKTESKAETEKVESKIDSPAKTEPKIESPPKAEPTNESSTKASSSSTPRFNHPDQNIDNALASKHVDDLLQKAVEAEDPPATRVIEDSSWDDEPEKVDSKKPESVSESVTKPEETQRSEPEPSHSKITDAEPEIKSEPVTSESEAPTPEAPTPEATKDESSLQNLTLSESTPISQDTASAQEGQVNLHSEVQNLSTKVLKLESSIAFLLGELTKRDERIEALDHQIIKLLNK